MTGRARLHHQLNQTAKRHARREQTALRGNITSLSPLTVEAFGYDHLLTEHEDFVLSGSMRLYHHVVGLFVGDLVLLHRTDSWILFDVVTHKNVEGHFDAWDTSRGPS